ncbi:MAG: hypothetical protein ACOC26_07270, partial [Halochromatium sp.]
MSRDWLINLGSFWLASGTLALQRDRPSAAIHLRVKRWAMLTLLIGDDLMSDTTSGMTDLEPLMAR